MKQGRANRDVSESWKREPMARAINVKGVSQIGQHLGDHITEKSKILHGVVEPVRGGRGFNAPAPMSQKTRNGGSQGRY